MPETGTRGPGRPRTDSVRADFAAGEELAAWLEDRARRMPSDMAPARPRRSGEGEPARTSVVSRRAQADLGVLRLLLDASLAELPALTPGEALALAHVTGGPVMSSSVAGPDSRPVLWQEALVTFAGARAPAAGGRLPAHPGSSCPAVSGIDEDALLAMLAQLTRAQDYALRDALSRWWQDGGGRDEEGAAGEAAARFRAAGLKITE